MNTSKRKILIIEDNQDIQELYKYAFEAGGYEVSLSKDGMAGLDETLNFKPDVILLDIMMPEMNGFEFLEALNNNEEIKDIPVAVITNLSQEQEKKKAIDKGASLYLEKSDFEGTDLVEKVNELFK
jgi:CheY-like chemotaxis protein